MNRLARLASLALLAACSARGTVTETIPNDDAATDAPATTDKPALPDVPMTFDVPVTPDVPVGPDVPAAPDVPVAPDVPTTTDAPQPTDVPTPSDAPSDAPSDVPVRPCVRDTDCLAGSFCSPDARCAPRVCVPDTSSCVTATRVRYCDARGTANTELECPGAASCTDGRCGVAMGCTAGAASCASMTERRVCNPDGMSYATTVCPAVAGAAGQCTGAGVCSVACMAGFGDCDMMPTNGCEAVFGTDSRNCGRCGTACAAGQSCVAGLCVAAPTPMGTPFQVVTLNTTGCRVIEHGVVTSDDHGGIAVGANSMFYTGDSATARFDLETLAPTTIGRVADGLVSNLRDGTVYTLATGATPIAGTGGTISALIELDAMTGAVTTRSIALSSPIVAASGATGIFAGFDRIVILASGRAYDISLPSGRVVDMGTMALPTHNGCETWAFWGVAEFFGGALYVDYVQSTTQISRTRIPDGMTATIGTFTNLSDMCSLSVSASRSRWYFHHEGSSQFGGTGETAGYCNATLSTSGTVTCPTGLTPCSGICVDLTSSDAHCGRCANPCGSAMACSAGVCATPTTFPRYTREAAPSTVTYADACTTGTRVLIGVDDNNVTTPPLAFPFRFWGALLPSGRTVNIASNGFLSLDGLSDYALGGSIPSVSPPNGVIAAFWRDLRTSASGVCYATLGTAPSRRFVVSWNATALYSGTGTFSAEVILNEADGAIDLLYNESTISSAVTATVGVENLTGSDSVGGCTAGSLCPIVPTTRIRFRPSL